MNKTTVLRSPEWVSFEQQVANTINERGGASLAEAERQEIERMDPEERLAFMAVYGALHLLMTTRDHQNLFARAPGLFAPRRPRDEETMRIAPNIASRAAELMDRVIRHAERHAHRAGALLNARGIGQVTVDHTFKPADTLGIEPELYTIANDEGHIMLEAAMGVELESGEPDGAHRVTGVVSEFAITVAT